MVIKEFFPVPILSVVAGSSVAFRSPVVERFHCIRTPTRLHYPARLHAWVITKYVYLNIKTSVLE